MEGVVIQLVNMNVTRLYKLVTKEAAVVVKFCTRTQLVRIPVTTLTNTLPRLTFHIIRS
jgi:hypothetical protein